MGVCCGQVLAWFLPSLIINVAVVATGLIWLLVGACRRGVCLGGIVGIAVAGWGASLHPPPIAGSDVQTLVSVEESPRRRVPGEVVFIGREILGGEGRLIRCRAVDLPWRSLTSVEQGDIVWVRGAITPVMRPVNPVSWDGWMWRRGVSGEMKVLFGTKALARSPSPLDRVRRWIIDSVTIATKDSRGGALFLSMAFGVRDVLSPPVEALFTNLGLSHLLVVSGYQVSLVFGVALSALLGVGRAIRPSLGMRAIGIGASLMCATLYVLAIGSEMSSVRALLAALCLCISLLMHRRHRFAQRLVVTFLCMNLVWPWALFEIGVLLTFAALAGIGIGSMIGGAGRWRSLVWVTVSVWTLTSVVTVVWNGTFSVSGVFLNLVLAAPWSVLNCAIGLGALALVYTGLPGCDLPLRVVAYINEVIVSGLFGTQTLLGASRDVSLVERSVTTLVLLVGAAILVTVARGRERALSLRAMVSGRQEPPRS